MNNDQENGTEQGSVAFEDLSQFFAPTWARSKPGEEIKTVSSYEEHRDNQRRDRRDQRPQKRGPGRENSERFPRKDDNQRRPQRDQQRNDRRERRDGEAPRTFVPKQEPLSLDVRFMPAGKALAAIVHRIQVTHKAYPIRDIVKLFQKDDTGMSVRIENNKEADGSQKPMFQCSICGMPALTEEEVVAHLFKDHIGDFFDIETVEGDAPSGNFPCVARCGITGELLGPPNHHSYARRLQEMLHDRFPGMSEEEYRRKIEIVRDPEVVEQWRNEAKKHVVYRLKQQKNVTEEVKTDNAPAPESTSDTPAEAVAETPAEVVPESPALDRFQAEQYFQREIIPQNITKASHIICPAVSLQHLANRRLAAYLSAKFAEEENPSYRKPVPAKPGENAQPAGRRQGSLFIAIHAAFHHRKLHFFRVGDDRGQEFVMATVPAPFDTTHATPELKAIVDYVQANPSCQAKELVEALNPDNDAEKAKHLISDINWLIERGNLIQFFNGALSHPAQHPVFKNHQEKKAPAKAKDANAEQPESKPEAATEEPAPAQDAPAAVATEQEAAPEVPAQAEESSGKTDGAETDAAEAAVEKPAEAPNTDTTAVQA